MKDFFDKYESGNKLAIIKRFNLINYEVVDSMYSYLNHIVNNWLGFQAIQGRYEYNALGQLFTKAMNMSRTELETKLPFELASRYIASYIQDNGVTCEDIFGSASYDTDWITQNCNTFDF